MNTTPRDLWPLADAATPYRAIVYGHKFAGPACEKALKDAGVRKIEIAACAYGLRQKSVTA